MNETVKFEGWLALRPAHHEYQNGLLRFTKKEPALSPGEIPLKISLQVPRSLFDTPTLQIVAEIPEGAALASEIPAEVQDNIAEVIRERTGIVVEISVPEEPED